MSTVGPDMGASGPAYDDLKRVREQLGAALTGIVCSSVHPDPLPAQVGALDGFGLQADGRDVRVSVYLYPQWGDGQEQAGPLLAAAERSGRYAIVGVNGRMLFLGTAVVMTSSPRSWLTTSVPSSAVTSRELVPCAGPGLRSRCPIGGPRPKRGSR